MALLTPARPTLAVYPDSPRAALFIDVATPALPTGSDGVVLLDVQWSPDNVNWADLRGATGIAPTAQNRPRDYEVPSDTLRWYRARSYTFDGDSGQFSTASAWSPAAGGSVAITEFWLKCPEQSSLNTRLDVDWADIVFDAPVDRGITYVPNRRTPIVDHGAVHSETISLTLWAPDPETERSIRALHQTSETLLFQLDTGEQYYVVLEGRMPRSRQPAAGSEPDFSIPLKLVEVDPV